MADKIIVKGSVYDTDSTGSENKLLDTKDIISGDGVIVEKQEDQKLKIVSDIGIKIVNGIPCAVFAVEETEG